MVYVKNNAVTMVKCPKNISMTLAHVQNTVRPKGKCPKTILSQWYKSKTLWYYYGKWHNLSRQLWCMFSHSQ